MLWDATNDRFVFSHGVVSGSTVLTGDQDISGIGTNSTNIATNVTNIATNVTNIATNATAISNIPANTNTTYSISCVDGANTDEEIIRLTDSGSNTDDVVLEAGTGLSIARDSDKITFTNTVAAETYTQHENISAASSNLDNSGRTYIQDITLDGNGHVTGVATATETVVNTNTNKFLSAVARNSQSDAQVNFTVSNGTNLTLTFGSLAFSSADIPTGNQILDWTTNVDETVIHAGNYTDTVYTHPQYGTTDIDTSGATIVDSIATNSTGHITAMGTRTLTLANLGFTGNSGANCVLGATQTLSLIHI